LICHAWELFQGQWDEQASDDTKGDDGKFHAQTAPEEFQDLAETKQPITQ
jgi:hypothetical protein